MTVALAPTLCAGVEPALAQSEPATASTRYALTELGRRALLIDELTAPFDPARSVAHQS